MAEHHAHPPSPEAWARVMYVLLGLCAVALVVFYFLGALSGRALLWVLALVGLAALSVTLRYLASPGRRD